MPTPRLLHQLTDILLTKRYSPRTIEIYRRWTVRYVRFHGLKHPAAMDAAHIRAFLSHLAAQGRVSASTQNQALAALLFLYREVLGVPMGAPQGVTAAKRSPRLPNVLSVEEVARVLHAITGLPALIASTLYGTGIRIAECCALRVKDIDFERLEVTVRAGKGGKDRRTMFPKALVVPFRAHLERVQLLHTRDLRAGHGAVVLPGALAKKLPSAATAFAWQWVFPAARRYVERGTGIIRRHHVDHSMIQRAVSEAGRTAGISKRVTCHTFRHSFATHLIEGGYDVRTVQELLGHTTLQTTMAYTHVLNKGGLGVRSPLDAHKFTLPASQDKHLPDTGADGA